LMGCQPYDSRPSADPAVKIAAAVPDENRASLVSDFPDDDTIVFPAATAFGGSRRVERAMEILEAAARRHPLDAEIHERIAGIAFKISAASTPRRQTFAPATAATHGRRRPPRAAQSPAAAVSFSFRPTFFSFFVASSRELGKQ